MIATCPSREDLEAFSLGKLPDDSIESIAEHLEACPSCEDTVVQFDDRADTFLENLHGPTPNDPFADESACREAVSAAKAVAAESSVTDQPPADAQAESLGRIGDYQLLAKLGHGGMGTVYRALHARMRRIVALKVLTTHRRHDPAVVERFGREIEVAGKLSHPNIVTAHDAGEDDGMHYLVMELVEGVDLHTLVSQHGPLPVADACEIIRQAALGLQHAHEHGLVHRDLKPSNLMLAIGGERRAESGEPGKHEPSALSSQPSAFVKILDLGLARLQDDHVASEQITATGQVMGTLDYMAPEQADDSHGVDIRADIYSLGCTLYKLLTGRAPFSGKSFDTPAKKILAHAQTAPPPIRDVRPDVPASLAAASDGMLAKDPAGRPATPADVAAMLEPFAAQHDLAALAAEVEPPANDDAVFASADEIPMLLGGDGGVVGGSMPDDRKPPRRRRPGGFWLWTGLLLMVVSTACQVFAMSVLFSYVNSAITHQGLGYFISQSLRPMMFVGFGFTLGVAFVIVGLVRLLLGAPAVEKAPSPAYARWRRWRRVAVGLIVLLMVGLTIVTVIMPHGQLVIETIDPDVQVEVRALKNGTQVAVVDARTGKTVNLVPGEYGVRVVGEGAADFELDTGVLTIRRFDRVLVRVTRKPKTPRDENRSVPVGVDHVSPVQAVPTPEPYVGDPHGDPLPSNKAVARLGSIRLRHGGRVHQMAFSPDGKWLASLGEDDAVRIWDPNTGQQHQRLVHRERGWMKDLHSQLRSALGFCFTPDGASIVSLHIEDHGSTKPSILCIWDVETGERKKSFPCGDGNFTSNVAVSPDGRVAAVGGRDGAVLVLNLDTGELHARLEYSRELKESSEAFRQHRPVRGVAFSPDGVLIAVFHDRGTILLWELATGKVTRSLQTSSDSQIAFSPDGKTLVGVDGRNVRIPRWDVATGRQLETLTGHTHWVSGVAFSPTGDWMVSVGSYTLRFWNAAGKLIRVLEYGSEDSYQGYGPVAVSPDGKTIAGATWCRIRLWDRETLRERLAAPWHPFAMDRIAFVDTTGRGAAKSKLTAPLVVASSPNQRWDLEPATKSQRGGATGPMRVSPQPQSTALPAWKFDPEAWWDTILGRRFDHLTDLGPDRELLTVLPQVKQFVTEDKDPVTGHRKSLTWWDLETGKQIHTLSFDAIRWARIAVSPNGKTVATHVPTSEYLVGDEVENPQPTGIVVRDVPSGKELRVFSKPKTWLLDFSPDSQVLRMLAADGALLLWNLAAPESVAPEVVPVPAGWVAPVPSDWAKHSWAIAPHNGLLAWSDGHDPQTGRGRIRLYDVQNRRELEPLDGHLGPVKSLAFSSDGGWLASGGAGGTGLIWDVAAAIETDGAASKTPAKAPAEKPPTPETNIDPDAGGKPEALEARVDRLIEEADKLLRTYPARGIPALRAELERIGKSPDLDPARRLALTDKIQSTIDKLQGLADRRTKWRTRVQAAIAEAKQLAKTDPQAAARRLCAVSGMQSSAVEILYMDHHAFCNDPDLFSLSQEYEALARKLDPTGAVKRRMRSESRAVDVRDGIEDALAELRADQRRVHGWTVNRGIDDVHRHLDRARALASEVEDEQIREEVSQEVEDAQRQLANSIRWGLRNTIVLDSYDASDGFTLGPLNWYPTNHGLVLASHGAESGPLDFWYAGKSVDGLLSPRRLGSIPNAGWPVVLSAEDVIRIAQPAGIDGDTLTIRFWDYRFENHGAGPQLFDVKWQLEPPIRADRADTVTIHAHNALDAEKDGKANWIVSLFLRLIDRDAPHRSQLLFVRSFDSGKTWPDPPKLVAEDVAWPEALPRAFCHHPETRDADGRGQRSRDHLICLAMDENHKAVLFRTHDGGGHWTKEVPLFPDPKTGNTVPGIPLATPYADWLLPLVHAIPRGDPAKRTYDLCWAWAGDGGRSWGAASTIAANRVLSEKQLFSIRATQSNVSAVTCPVPGDGPDDGHVELSLSIGRPPHRIWRTFRLDEHLGGHVGSTAVRAWRDLRVFVAAEVEHPTRTENRRQLIVQEIAPEALELAESGEGEARD